MPILFHVYMHYLIPFLPFCPSCWFSSTLISFSLCFYVLSFSILLSSIKSPFLLTPLPPLCYSLSFLSLSSALPTFLLYSSTLSSPLFVSPLFSSPVLSSPRPSVYPIWPSHLSWELSQGTRLLIQFLLNLMALSSAFAIPATHREKKAKETEKHKNLSGSPQKTVPGWLK